MLEVVDGGLVTTVQGAGRPAMVTFGVPIGGACDRWSLALANALLGNNPTAPALEMALLGPTLRVRADCAVGLAGADLSGRLDDGTELRPGSARLLRAGQVLTFSSATPGSGVRAYLALAGGVDVPDVLGSPSTCLIGGFGGLEGRPLAAGDTISPRDPGGRRVGSWDGAAMPAAGPLRVVRGPHASELPDQALAGLLEGFFVVGRGDRQGIRLEGPSIKPGSLSLVSQPMRAGAVQLPPDGRPIALLVDHQTVGGYPVPAVVIGADLPRLGQLGAGDGVRFREVGLGQARVALLGLEQELSLLGSRVAIA